MEMTGHRVGTCFRARQIHARSSESTDRSRSIRPSLARNSVQDVQGGQLMIAAMPLTGNRAQKRLRWMLFSALAMGMLSLTAGSGTLAYFTTQVQSNNNTFTAGNLRFNILDSISTTGQYPSVGSSLSLLNMKPGDVVYAPIQLNNTGNIAAKFGIKYSTTKALANNSNGGTISATATTLVDSGRTVANGLSFGASSYGSLVNDFVLITAGTDSGDFRKITSVTAP